MQELGQIPTGAILTLVGTTGAAISLFLDAHSDLVARGSLVDLSTREDMVRTLSLDVPSEWVSQITTKLPAPSEWVEGKLDVELPDLPPLRITIRHFNPESKLWVGEVNNKLTDESINFTFQELHSPDVTVVVVTILGILCGISVLADLLRGCEKRAEEACGVGKVKSVKTKKSWAGIASCNLECEFVCKD